MRSWTKHILIGLASILAGAVTYFFLGIALARIKGQGHFYSWPFGGYSVGGSDSVLMTSLAFWIILWFLALAKLFQQR